MPGTGTAIGTGMRKGRGMGKETGERKGRCMGEVVAPSTASSSYLLLI
jgi:hypothetical protein